MSGHACMSGQEAKAAGRPNQPKKSIFERISDSFFTAILGILVVWTFAMPVLMVVLFVSLGIYILLKLWPSICIVFNPILSTIGWAGLVSAFLTPVCLFLAVRATFRWKTAIARKEKITGRRWLCLFGIHGMDVWIESWKGKILKCRYCSCESDRMSNTNYEDYDC